MSADEVAKQLSPARLSGLEAITAAIPIQQAAEDIVTDRRAPLSAAPGLPGLAATATFRAEHHEERNPIVTDPQNPDEPDAARRRCQRRPPARRPRRRPPHRRAAAAAPTPQQPVRPAAYAAAPPPAYGAPATATIPGRTMGIVAFILSFFVQLAALILGIIALVQSRKAGHKNGWAVAAIIISCVLMVLGVILFFALVIPLITFSAEALQACQAVDFSGTVERPAESRSTAPRSAVAADTHAAARSRTARLSPCVAASVEDAAVGRERADAVDPDRHRGPVAKEHLRVPRVAGAARAAGRDQRAGQQGDRLRQVRDERRHRADHLAGRGILQRPAVEDRPDVQVLRVGDLVGGDHERTGRA